MHGHVLGNHLLRVNGLLRILLLRLHHRLGLILLLLRLLRDLLLHGLSLILLRDWLLLRRHLHVAHGSLRMHVRVGSLLIESLLVVGILLLLLLGSMAIDLMRLLLGMHRLSHVLRGLQRLLLRLLLRQKPWLGHSHLTLLWNLLKVSLMRLLVVI